MDPEELLTCALQALLAKEDSLARNYFLRLSNSLAEKDHQPVNVMRCVARLEYVAAEKGKKK